MFFWNSLAFLMIQQVRSPRTFTLPVEVALSVCTLSCVQLFVTPWTVACQAPLSMEFSRQEYWSRLPFPPSGDFPDPGIKPKSLASPALAGRSLPLHHWRHFRREMFVWSVKQMLPHWVCWGPKGPLRNGY